MKLDAEILIILTERELALAKANSGLPVQLPCLTDKIKIRIEEEKERP